MDNLSSISIEDYIVSNDLTLVQIGFQLLYNDDTLTNEQKDAFLTDIKERNMDIWLVKRHTQLNHTKHDQIDKDWWYFLYTKNNVPVRVPIGKLIDTP